MIERICAAALALGLAATAAGAQHAQHGGHHGAHGRPYAGLQKRPIKALSTEEIAGLRAGDGMGQALAAELNGYPGPRHVLDLADRLSLRPDQRAAVEALHAEMKREAAAAGEKVIAAEAALDRKFAQGAIDEPGLAEAMREIAAARAEVRSAHLRAHLKTKAILTPDQLTAYAAARGYR